MIEVVLIIRLRVESVRLVCYISDATNLGFALQTRRDRRYTSRLSAVLPIGCGVSTPRILNKRDGHRMLILNERERNLEATNRTVCRAQVTLLK
jgi:hypothetical protein